MVVAFITEFIIVAIIRGNIEIIVVVAKIKRKHPTIVFVFITKHYPETTGNIMNLVIIIVKNPGFIIIPRNLLQSFHYYIIKFNLSGFHFQSYLT